VPGAPKPRLAPTLIEPAAPAVTAPEHARPERTIHGAARRSANAKVAVIVGGASLALGVIVGAVVILLWGC
jgi:hypothetical protein